MENIAILEGRPGESPTICIRESEYHDREISLAAISSWSELLGISDPVEVLEAIIHVQDHDTDSEPEGGSRDNVWTDPYRLLQYREQAREREALRAKDYPDLGQDYRSPLLRSSLAAHNAVHQPVDGGECAMDRCRRVARETLGIKEPSAKPKASSRMSTTMTLAHAGEGDREVLAAALSSVAPIIDAQRREFLHSLGGGAENPLGDTVPPPEPEPVDPLSAALQRYGASGE